MHFAFVRASNFNTIKYLTRDCFANYCIMAQIEGKKIKLPQEVDIYKKSHEKRYEQKYEQSYDLRDSNICLSHDILRIIFRHLNGKDLSNAAMVCRSWFEIACYEEWLRGPQCLGPYFYSTQRLNLNYIKQSIITPSIGFFFLSCDELQPFYSDIVRDLICKALPKNCKAIMLFANTIIFNNNVNLSQNMVCALFPQISNVKIHMVKVTKISHRELKGGLRKYRQMIASFTPRHGKSSCLMIFCNYRGSEIAYKMVKIAGNSYHKKIDSCWGGAVTKLLTNEKYYEEYIDDTIPYCIALLITGSIQTWSVNLDLKEKTEEEIERKLKLFKKQVKLRKHSVGFMIASEICRYYYGTKYAKMESVIFKNLFPGIPLVGCFGLSQYGKDNTVHKVPGYPILNNTWWTDGYATIFMILTYN